MAEGGAANATVPVAGAAAGLSVVRADALETLADHLSRGLDAVSDDPFAEQVVLVRNPTHRRWLTQRLAGSGEGICAGVRMRTPAWLRAMLDDALTVPDDPWSMSRLPWHVVRAAQDDPNLVLLRNHLERSHESYTAASRVAALLRSYARHRPGMVTGWTAGTDAGPDGEPLGVDTWQAVLWRALRRNLPGPDPLERATQTVAAVEGGRSADLLPRTLWWLAPEEAWSPGDETLFRALARHHDLRVLMLSARSPASSSVPTRGERSPATLRAGTRLPLNTRLGRLAWERDAVFPVAGDRLPGLARPATVLGRVQRALVEDRPPEPAALDDSVRIVASHGLDRQVEVLREIVTGLLADDPTLEPRDVIVLTPSIERVGPLVTAAFGLDATQAWAHPGHGLRVQLSERTVRHDNPLMALLLEVLSLGTSRASIDQLLQLAANPAIAATFGFGPDDIDRLATLCRAAHVNWGVNAAHRAAFGLGHVRQNTWITGVQRLLLGVSLSEDGLPSLGTALPVDDIESSDVALLGSLAELVGRLGRLTADASASRTVADWLDLCAGVADSLFTTSSDDAWQRAELLEALADVQPGAVDLPVPLAAILTLLRREFDARTSRVAFGNGSLALGSLAALHALPHRVVCLVGFDPEGFPRRAPEDGDDLLRRSPRVGDPEPAFVDRQRLLEAVLSARETLVIVHQGYSPATNEEVPTSASLADVIDAFRQAVEPSQRLDLVRRGTLNPYSPAAFAGPRPASFDRVAHGVATAVTLPAPVVAARPLAFPAWSGSELGLDELTAFLGDPAAALRRRAGLPPGRRDSEADRLPIGLDGLGEWRIGERMLAAALRGEDPEAVRRAEWLRGEVPPGALGQRVVSRAFEGVARIMRSLPAQARAVPQAHDIRLDLDGVLLTGRVDTRGTDILAVEYSRLGARHKLTAWVRALALASMEPETPVIARVLARDRPFAVQAPPSAAAKAHLATLVGIFRDGWQRPLPMPVRCAERYATLALKRQAPSDPKELVNALKREWALDEGPDWRLAFPDGDVFQVLAPEAPYLPGDDPTWFGALARVVWEPLLAAVVP